MYAITIRTLNSDNVTEQVQVASTACTRLGAENKFNQTVKNCSLPKALIVLSRIAKPTAEHDYIVDCRIRSQLITNT